MDADKERIVMHEKRFEGNIERLRTSERVERLDVERVVDLCLENETAASVLDIGTGTGLFAEASSKRGLVVSGVDANPEILVAARQFVPEGALSRPFTGTCLASKKCTIYGVNLLFRVIFATGSASIYGN
jgi:2-polyprenyl-3-methyl-5-hydroxy-6-metoxy-1,4-benzoquinol methylase